MKTPTPPSTSKAGKRKTSTQEFEAVLSKRSRDNIGKNDKAKNALQSYLPLSTCRGVTSKTLDFKYINNKTTKNLSRSDQVEEVTSCGTTANDGNPSKGVCPPKPVKPAQIAEIALSNDKQPEDDLSAGSRT